MSYTPDPSWVQTTPSCWSKGDIDVVCGCQESFPEFKMGYLVIYNLTPQRGYLDREGTLHFGAPGYKLRKKPWLDSQEEAFRVAEEVRPSGVFKIDPPHEEL